MARPSQGFRAFIVLFAASLLATALNIPGVLAQAEPGGGVAVGQSQLAATQQDGTGQSGEDLSNLSSDELYEIGVSMIFEGPAALDATRGLEALIIASHRNHRPSIRLLAKAMVERDLRLGDEAPRLLGKFGGEAMSGASSCVLAVATIHDRGDGVPLDIVKAFEWYLWAARVGNQRAMLGLTYAYATGRGTQADDNAAFEWIERIEPRRTRQMLLDIGWALWSGKEGRQDREAATAYLERAVTDHPDTAASIAENLREGTYGASDPELAERFLHLAAQFGETDEAFALERSGSRDDLGRALEIYVEQASESSDDVVGVRGMARLLGLSGSNPEFEALILSQIAGAADAGNVEALIVLANIYTFGSGADVSLERAAGYLQRAAELGDVEAQYKLGLIYANGLGVEPNAETARYWLESARAQNHPLAEVTLQGLASGGEGEVGVDPGLLQ